MIVAGFGFREAAGLASILDALARAAGADRATHLSVARDMADHGGFRDAVAELALPLIAVDRDAMVAIDTPTQSPRSIAARGVGSVAEAVAMAAAGEGATLTGPRSISGDRMATCAIAVGASS